VSLPFAVAPAGETNSTPAVSPSVQPGPRVEGTLIGLRLLVTDDSDINRDVAKRILEHAGAQVTTCESGAATLEVLRRTADYDVVLMDVQMPNMDGNETTRRIRSELGLSNLCVIGLTAGALRAERQRSLAAGMNDFLTKPIEPHTLVKCIRKHVPHDRAEQALPQAPDPTKPAPKKTGEAAQAALRLWPSVAGLDVRAIAADLNYEAPEYAVMLSRLLRDGAEIVNTDNHALDDEAARAQLASRVHKLRGSAGVLGAKHLWKHAGDLDDALKGAQPSTVVLPLLQTLRVCCSELSAALAPWIQRVQVANAATQAATTATPKSAAAPSDAELQHLLTLLRANDLAAMGHLTALSAGLRGVLGEAGFQALHRAVSELDFAKAAELVSQLRAA
jgi:CheY-like chemotaxis protein